MSSRPLKSDANKSIIKQMPYDSGRGAPVSAICCMHHQKVLRRGFDSRRSQKPKEKIKLVTKIYF